MTQLEITGWSGDHIVAPARAAVAVSVVVDRVGRALNRDLSTSVTPRADNARRRKSAPGSTDRTVAPARVAVAVPVVVDRVGRPLNRDLSTTVTPRADNARRRKSAP